MGWEKFQTHVGYLNIINHIHFQAKFIPEQTSLFLAHQIVLF